MLWKIHTNFILGKILSTGQNMSPFSKSVIRVPAQNFGNIHDSQTFIRAAPQQRKVYFDWLYPHHWSQILNLPVPLFPSITAQCLLTWGLWMMKWAVEVLRHLPAENLLWVNALTAQQLSLAVDRDMSALSLWSSSLGVGSPQNTAWPVQRLCYPVIRWSGCKLLSFVSGSYINISQ
jgi:hypothetical protein